MNPKSSALDVPIRLKNPSTDLPYEFALDGVKEALTLNEWLQGLKVDYTYPAKWFNYLYNVIFNAFFAAKWDYDKLFAEFGNVLEYCGFTPVQNNNGQLLMALFKGFMDFLTAQEIFGAKRFLDEFVLPYNNTWPNNPSNTALITEAQVAAMPYFEYVPEIDGSAIDIDVWSTGRSLRYAEELPITDIVGLTSTDMVDKNDKIGSYFDGHIKALWPQSETPDIVKVLPIGSQFSRNTYNDHELDENFGIKLNWIDTYFTIEFKSVTVIREVGVTGPISVQVKIMCCLVCKQAITEAQDRVQFLEVLGFEAAWLSYAKDGRLYVCKPPQDAYVDTAYAVSNYWYYPILTTGIASYIIRFGFDSLYSSYKTWSTEYIPNRLSRGDTFPMCFNINGVLSAG